jgi:ABC-2 type transport system permease protein
MAIWIHEARLLLRSRLALAALLLMALLSAAAVAAGMAEVARQRAAIDAVATAQAEDIAAVADYVDRTKDGGSAAYYSFHPTWDSPSPLAFAAIGMRDVAPYILRVRALGLEAQIYDGDTFNPELALPGRFDFAFVLVFLGPLFAIALFHDLKSAEREAGRARMLDAMPNGRRLWFRRAMVRFVLLLAALIVPFVVGAVLSGVAVWAMLLIVVVAALYLLFWIGLAALVSRRGHGSTANAATLAGLWLVLVLVIPTFANVAINRAIPVGQGSEIALAQRERVHGAWEIPREETMRRFYAPHPQWANSPPLPPAFHYKWYFAFHQVGDESVADRVRA